MYEKLKYPSANMFTPKIKNLDTTISKLQLIKVNEACFGRVS